MKRSLLAVLTATALVCGSLTVAAPASSATAPSIGPLTNLGHLNALGADVTVTPTAEHSTYQLAQRPAVGVLWVYANHQADGSYTPVGGGAYDPTTGHWGQGSYDADDISRASVVYTRQWLATGNSSARDHAFQLLRGLTYLQTASGPNAGNVVLWMQPDGSLNPTPTPPDSPNPSDTGASYWLARTLWALGEGYSAFRSSDPGFADFLRHRLDLAVAALDREVLVNYGTYHQLHGTKVPAWLIADGADASSEASLGLAAYVRAGGSSAARTALAELTSGIAQLHLPNVGSWPYGALLPWAGSLSVWHAWGAQMPSALARAAAALSEPSLLQPAIADSATFDPWLLTSYGPVNGLLPTAIDRTQIAYGADARVQGLLAVGTASGRSDIRRLAGVAAGWFFGQNNAGIPSYNPATGVTYDGVNSDGSVNRNSGAESTIHGLLTMQALDANPDLAAIAEASGHVDHRDGARTIEAESATLHGPATVVTPASAWTGEAQYGGGRYVDAGSGASLTFTLPPTTTDRTVALVLNLDPHSAAQVRLTAGREYLGTVDVGATGLQGDAASPTLLLPVQLPREVRGSDTVITATVFGGSASIDSLVYQPTVTQLDLSGNGRQVTLLSNITTHAQHSESGSRQVTIPASSFRLLVN